MVHSSRSNNQTRNCVRTGSDKQIHRKNNRGISLLAHYLIFSQFLRHQFLYRVLLNNSIDNEGNEFER